MKYKYIDKKLAIGDVVAYTSESNDRLTEGKAYLVTGLEHSKYPQVTNDNCSERYSFSRYKIIATKPGKEAIKGDTVLRVKNGTSSCPTGTVFKVLDTCCDLGYAAGFSAHPSGCIVLQTEQYGSSLHNHTDWEDSVSYSTTIAKLKESRTTQYRIDKTGQIVIIDQSCKNTEGSTCYLPVDGSPLIYLMTKQVTEITQDNPKENVMTPTIGTTTITLTEAEYKTLAKETIAKPLTELQMEDKRPHMAKIFNEAGKHTSKLHAKTEKKLHKLITAHLAKNQFDDIRILAPNGKAKAEQLPVVFEK